MNDVVRRIVAQEAEHLIDVVAGNIISESEDLENVEVIRMKARKKLFGSDDTDARDIMDHGIPQPAD